MTGDMNQIRAPKVKKRAGAIRPGTQRRIERSFYFVLAPLFLLGARLVYLQGMGGDEAVDFGREKRQIIEPRRADILAADGTALAVTLDEYAVCANPRAAVEKEKMARLVALAIGGDEQEYLAQLGKTERADGRKNFYVRLAKRVDEARVQKLKKLMRVPEGVAPDASKTEIKAALEKETAGAKKARREFWSALSFEASPRRTYPLGNFASQLIGFTAPGGKGVDGMERSFDQKLAGRAGEIVSPLDGQNRPIPGFVSTMTPAIEGRTVVTTIDTEIQSDADAALNAMVKKWRPNFAVAIVMKPDTGEVVAMSTAPSYNPNKLPTNVSQLATNRATQFYYEPGSTFKIITAAAAVENVPNWENKSYYVTGAEKVGSHVIHDWQWWSGKAEPQSRTLSSGIRDSSNITMWHFARQVGAPKLVDYADRFGVGKRIDSPGLRGPAGRVASLDERWSAEQLANFSFGQGMTMTPLHLAQMVGAIANDGIMMKPMLVKEVRDAGGKAVQKYAPVAMPRAIEPETARSVGTMMERVMSEGTARKAAFVPGYRTAGKTGSAQKAVKNSAGKYVYSSGHFISSLAGYIPAKNPKYVIVVVADEPRGSHWGSEVCGPPWAEIAGKAMLRLRLREGASAPAPDPTWLKLPQKK